MTARFRLGSITAATNAIGQVCFTPQAQVRYARKQVSFMRQADKVHCCK